MEYYIKQESVDKIMKIFSDFEIKPNAIRDYLDMDPESALKICDHKLNYPLLLDSTEEYYKSEEAIMTIPLFRHRLNLLIEHEEYEGHTFDTDDKFYDGYSWNNGYPCTITDLIVFSGLNVISIFKDKIFTLDYKKYGFLTWGNMIFSLCAYISNSNGYKSPPIYSWTTDLGDRVVRNSYTSSIHGDFRMEQEDISLPECLISPFKDVIDFIPTRKPECISAYHSVEISFLYIIKRFAEQFNIESKILSNYSTYSDKLLSDGGSMLGNFGDAGMNESFINYTAYKKNKIQSVGEEEIKFNFFNLPMEHSGCQFAFIDGEDLIFIPSENRESVSFENLATAVRFKLRDIEHLIHGLHLQCQLGAGRTSIGNLRNALEKKDYEEKFKLKTYT